MRFQPLAVAFVTTAASGGQFFASQRSGGEKGVDALGSDPHNSPAQLSGTLLKREE